MAPDVAAVDKLLEDLRLASLDAGKRDLKDLQEMAKNNGQKEPLIQWDTAFWAERLREERFNYTDEEIRPYFQMPKVLKGLFDLCNKLFHVHIEKSSRNEPIWHPDVEYYLVKNDKGEELAGFYLDPYSRPEDKQGGAWMNVCQGRMKTEQGIQLPVAYIICNGTPPVKDQASLLSFREVETLFHEFGHGLQHMLTIVEHSYAAGISGVEWDAVELPSQFMENWCYHRDTLIGLTEHVETGEPLPDSLFDKIKAARTFQSGAQMLRQLQFGMVDIELHHRHRQGSGEEIHQVLHRIGEKTATLPLLPEDRSLCSFSHIFAGGYAAGYYSYKWAEVLSADAFSAFEEVGLDNEPAIVETGLRFRDTVLASGGGQHPMEVFKSFRGRDPSIDALLRHSGLK